MQPVTVCFDFDSTLSTVEGIDELAVRQGVGDALARLTEAAMNGSVALQEVYARRLELLQPDRDSMTWLSRRYLATITPGAGAVLAELMRLPVTVHIISGGLRPAILASAARLGIEAHRVHAVDVHFDAAGGYVDFDHDSPLARSGGKAEVCRRLAEAGRGLVMVGDGYTDLEAQQAGALMVAFTGVVARPKVVEAADRVLDDLADLPDLLTDCFA
ncbi:MAG: HAD-IB family phosphatase [Methylococcales bacterium]|nr:HAD-IB family phosphatase [Methylococcales bacterium]